MLHLTLPPSTLEQLCDIHPLLLPSMCIYACVSVCILFSLPPLSDHNNIIRSLTFAHLPPHHTTTRTYILFFLSSLALPLLTPRSFSFSFSSLLHHYFL
ncbi:hypothetical protein BKA57DRAFT_323470 [Linnemannia elongata]|nr:hypothetical protein BKA57DRAFT_323470 [Linnemannia elongata]